MNKISIFFISITTLGIISCSNSNNVSNPSIPSSSPSTTNSANPSPNPNKERFNSKAELIAFLECVKSKSTQQYQKDEMDNEIKRVNQAVLDLSDSFYETKTWLSTLSTAGLKNQGVSCL